MAGRLTMETVTSLYGTDLQGNGKDALEIDFAKVEAVDSAAVSLLLCWLRRAQQHNTMLRFSNMPDNLLSLAHLYGVAELFPAAA